MKYLKYYNQINETQTYAPDDIVNIHYEFSDIPVPAKIIKKNGNTYTVNLNTESSPLSGRDNIITIKSIDIVGLFQANDAPAMGQPLSTFKANKTSNDIVINNYPKGI